MGKYNRVFLVVLDSLGIGEMPDSKEYNDKGVNTLKHVWDKKKDLCIPNLRKLGLGNLLSEDDVTQGYYLKLKELSVGKDTMTGHWEMMGLHIKEPFQTFTDTGFPTELIDALEQKCKKKFVGNKFASGTDIIDEYGEHEIKTGELILYTSADSVLQICGHEVYTGLDALYECCEIARELTMKPEWKVGRVIARPYIGESKGNFKRTSNRHDYALKPFSRTILDDLKDSGYDVIGIGKINDIFAGEGITKSYSSTSSVHGIEQTIEMTSKNFKGLCFVNLVDFDALWGHRRDPLGYAKELEMFDEKLGMLLNHLKEDDLLLITADHGNDPTYIGTDHTREMVPLLCYSPSMKSGGVLPTQETFATIGTTIADNFKIKTTSELEGHSILNFLK
ncbi:phosphopentomutase [Clostridioides difficile CD002]|uniref:phosphopentomutase n=1 Tax=Clostridioides difficile TaxID=1496 RepID=UPI0003B2A414|nr:phosphopentomutase [Clostridioides difficile]CCL07905.1 phosphopentomutase [Clostridioides difficile CD002]